MSDPSTETVITPEMIAALAPQAEHLAGGLERYFNHRIRTGGFLEAVLKNDLHEAFARASPESVRALPAVVAWLHEFAPRPAFGSPEAVEAWLDPDEDRITPLDFYGGTYRG